MFRTCLLNRTPRASKGKAAAGGKNIARWLVSNQRPLACESQVPLPLEPNFARMEMVIRKQGIGNYKSDTHSKEEVSLSRRAGRQVRGSNAASMEFSEASFIDNQRCKPLQRLLGSRDLGSPFMKRYRSTIVLGCWALALIPRLSGGYLVEGKPAALRDQVNNTPPNRVARVTEPKKYRKPISGIWLVVINDGQHNRKQSVYQIRSP